MALNGTMVKIETVTVGSGGAANIEFTNIPQTYTDLVLVSSTRSSSGTVNFRVSFNGSTTGYSSKLLYGNGSSAASENNAVTTAIDYSNYANASTETASTFSNNQVYIPNYAGSTNKSVSVDTVRENNATAALVGMTAGLWSNTAAITSIKIDGGTNFAQYSTATLYGISKTTAQIKATGGMVYDDASYVYHLFTSSGTFTPSQALTADVLVVAGGGGAGVYAGGGGGGGGVITFTNQSLSATGYTCTVGAGGAKSPADGTASSPGANSSFGALTVAVGGGGGGGKSTTPSFAGQNGGSGGGGGGKDGTAGGTTTQTGTGATNFYGNNGGQGVAYAGAGGGGAGAAAATAIVNGAASGGIGKYDSLINAMGAATSTGELSGGNYYFSGGGAGYAGSGISTYALGGGGGANRSENGIANTGGGGGLTNTTGIQGNGGSGIVIVRYAK